MDARIRIPNPCKILVRVLSLGEALAGRVPVATDCTGWCERARRVRDDPGELPYVIRPGYRSMTP